MLQLKITIYNSRASISLHSINPFNTTREKNTRNKHLSFPSIQFQSFPLQFETIIPYTGRISRSSTLRSLKFPSIEVLKANSRRNNYAKREEEFRFASFPDRSAAISIIWVTN